MNIIHNNLNEFIIENYKNIEERNLELEEFELVDGDSLKNVEYPTSIQDISCKILQTGAAIDYLTYIPNSQNYINPNKLNTIARICKLPNQINHVKDALTDKSVNKQESESNAIVKVAKLTTTTCKILATTAFIAQPLLPTAGIAIATSIGYTTGSVSKLIDYGLTAHEIYNKFTNNV